MTKDFESWNNTKITLDALGDDKIPRFNEGDVWWCSLGLNIGFEIFGKGASFSRPVLIFKKTSRFMFVGIPFTKHQRDDRPFWYPYPYKGQKGSLAIEQIRGFDGRRLLGRMGSISPDDFLAIKAAVKNML